jgi:hypothetical protein
MLRMNGRNALVYGAKKWYMYPPHDMVMSNVQIREFLDTDMKRFETRTDFRPFRAQTCVQTSGERGGEERGGRVIRLVAQS